MIDKGVQGRWANKLRLRGIKARWEMANGRRPKKLNPGGRGRGRGRGDRQNGHDDRRDDRGNGRGNHGNGGGSGGGGAMGMALI